MANPRNPIHDYAHIPGVLGVARCSENTDNIEIAGTGVEVLGELLIYLHQTAALIGEAFGLEDLNEVQVHSKGANALCLPRVGETLGLLLAPTARPADIVARVAKIHGEI